jgi:uncharacterized protein (DUF1684 family)
MSALSDFRQAKDAFFKSDDQSPLSREQKKDFGGLHYYPENEDFEFELPLEKAAAVQRVVMATSTGEQQEYWLVGVIRFTVQGQAAVLQVYRSVHGGDPFIPFVDATAPGETYGAGRYLEPELLPGGRLRVDFNMAYNPYCAYNDAWSCPLAPVENRLSVRIEAGEKKYHD